MQHDEHITPQDVASLTTSPSIDKTSPVAIHHRGIKKKQKKHKKQAKKPITTTKTNQ